MVRRFRGCKQDMLCVCVAQGEGSGGARTSGLPAGHLLLPRPATLTLQPFMWPIGVHVPGCINPAANCTLLGPHAVLSMHSIPRAACRSHMHACSTAPCPCPCPDAIALALQALSEEAARLSVLQEQLATQQQQLAVAALRSSGGGASPTAAAAVAARAASLAAREAQLLQQQQDLADREKALLQVRGERGRGVGLGEVQQGQISWDSVR